MSVIDRLEELKQVFFILRNILQKYAQKALPPGTSLEPLTQPLLEKSTSEQSESPENTSSKGMKNFMAKIDIAQQKLEILMRNNDKIQELIDEYNSQNISTEANRISDTIDEMVSENNELYKALNSVIAHIKVEVEGDQKNIEEQLQEERDKQNPNESQNTDQVSAMDVSPELRMKKTIYGSFVGRFQTVLKQTNSLQAEYKKTVRENLKKQIKIANPKLSEEELEKSVADPEQGKQLLSQQMLGVHEKVKSTIQDIETKYKEILVLEKSVQQVHQMFEVLAGLVEEQSEMLDNIEHNMSEAKNYVEKGEKNVILARKWYQQTRTVFF